MGRLMYNDIDYSGSEVIELTQADYDALPSSKYYDDVTYLISDVYSPSSTKNMGLGDCYSTTEKVIGCWIDGTPVYQKTWDLGQNVTIPNNAWTYLDGVTIPNHKFTITAICVDINGSVFHLVASNYENDKVGIWNARNSSIGVRYITIKYTKTTDVAGSGNWTPEGVPAVHYSTSEQVIGTWIDGKTLYQATVVIDNPTKQSGNNKYYYDTSYNGHHIDYLQVMCVSVFDSRDNRWYDLPYNRILSSEDIACQKIKKSDGDFACTVHFGTSQNYNLTKIVYTLQYTKTS